VTLYRFQRGWGDNEPNNAVIRLSGRAVPLLRVTGSLGAPRPLTVLKI